MRKSVAWLLGGLSLVTIVQLGSPARVSACPGRRCSSGATLPEGGGVLPANAVELLFRQPTTKLGSAEQTSPPHLYRLDGDARTEIAIAIEERAGLLHIRPQQPLSPSSSLVLEYSETCSTVPDGGLRMDVDAPVLVQHTLEVTSAAPIPSTLGSLHAELNRGWVELTYGSMCSQSYDGAYADLRVELDESARPYADSLRFAVEVDGRMVEPYGFYRGAYEPAWRLGASQLGPARDRLYTLCDRSAPSFASEQTEGTHAVRMRALLADDTAIWSSTVMVALRCRSADSSPAAGCSLSGAKHPGSMSSLAFGALVLGHLRARRQRRSHARPH